jgi:hypothetical protein
VGPLCACRVWHKPLPVLRVWGYPIMVTRDQLLRGLALPNDTIGVIEA